MIKDLTGQKFGHLKAIKHDGYSDHKWLWLCQCDCGKQTKVTSSHLLSGHTTSCGHVQKDRNNSVAPGYEAKRVNGVATFLLSDKRKVRTDSSTGITGVKEHKKRDGSIDYEANITIASKRHYLGRFHTIQEAAKVRKDAENKLIPKQGD
ncbi:hypothetical protein LOOC260_110050 [Paucilactobacillus hokkaidonensis JCM 18461]|uniref:AP2/ERF domain-containing protein n=2 Tax=Paucilactobacillus hokkaidonensis TaxID=1193095 RepID=A0A0A1GXC6_9LACO|nr:AP2 domain-containing protein [Paucilactobacillus hokkaidonensis]KRO09789.1 hypothetical protein IV59_GL000402 [Paucilactobacillus hokkaidonensis]BAP85544.1 hypothetical protein LOOC260_110050 [Paucilactobacillus hokkaidonensis JCM 18461]